MQHVWVGEWVSNIKISGKKVHDLSQNYGN